MKRFQRTIKSFVTKLEIFINPAPPINTTNHKRKIDFPTTEGQIDNCILINSRPALKVYFPIISYH